MELNREQIIKALECCKDESINECVNCPYNVFMNCDGRVRNDAFSLIKELTEENKAWQMQLISQEEKASKAYYDLACEVEDLRAIAEQYQKQFEDCAEDKAKLTEENERLRADVVEVVRCKDCIHARNMPLGLCYLHTEPYDNAKGYKGDAVCVEPNDFCSCGERREE